MPQITISVEDHSFTRELIQQKHGILKAKNIIMEVFTEFMRSERYQNVSPEEQSNYVLLHEDMQGFVDSMHVTITEQGVN